MDWWSWMDGWNNRWMVFTGEYICDILAGEYGYLDLEGWIKEWIHRDEWMGLYCSSNWLHIYWIKLVSDDFNLDFSRPIRSILIFQNRQFGFILMISNLLHSSSWNYSDVSLVISNFTPHQIGYALVITMFYVDYSNSFLLMTMDALIKLDEW